MVRRMLLPMAMAALASGPTPAAAQFTETELFFELNDTDGDLGLHASIDGAAYSRLEVEDPSERTLLVLTAQGSLADQGLTQLMLESAEPSFDELAPEDFFRRFPEGRYELEATSLEGEEVEATVRLSHVLAAPADDITVSGVPAAEDCDADPLPTVSEPVVIDWEPVTESHPEIGKRGRVDIDRYQFFVEQGDVKFSVDLPPDVTEFEVPSAILAAGGTFKFEIIARTTSGNNTAVENCFILE